MRIKRSLLAPALASVGVVGGCAVGPRTLEGLPALEMRPVDQTIFPRAGELLDGFDVGEIRGGWRTGDQALVGAVLERAGRRTVRYILLELTPLQGPLTSIRVSRAEHHAGVTPLMITRGVQLTLVDAKGEEMERSIAWVPERLLDHGPYDLLDFMARSEAAHREAGDAAGPAEQWMEQAWDSDEGRQALLGMAALMSLGRSAGGNGAATRLALEMLTFAQSFAALTQGVSIEEDDEGVERIRSPSGRPAYRVPVSLKVGRHIAVRTLVQVDRPDAPLGLIGGMVAIDGRNTIDESRRVHLRLLGARRGP